MVQWDIQVVPGASESNKSDSLQLKLQQQRIVVMAISLIDKWWALLALVVGSKRPFRFDISDTLLTSWILFETPSCLRLGCSCLMWFCGSVYQSDYQAGISTLPGVILESIIIMGLRCCEYVILQISDGRNPGCNCCEIILTSKSWSEEGPRCPILWYDFSRR